MNGGDDGTRTRGLCRDSAAMTSTYNNLQGRQGLPSTCKYVHGLELGLKLWVKHEVCKHAIFAFLNSDVGSIPIARSSFLLITSEVLTCSLKSRQIHELGAGRFGNRGLPRNYQQVRFRSNAILSPKGNGMSSMDSVIVKNPKMLGGTPVFRGTRVPFQALLDYLEGGETLDEFLEDFPSVTRESAISALERAKIALVGQIE